MELKCTPEVEARVFRDTYKVSIEAFRQLGDLGCPVMIAAGTEPVAAAIEAEAPLIAAQIQRGRFEKWVATPSHIAFPRVYMCFKGYSEAIAWSWAEDRCHCLMSHKWNERH